MKWTAGVACLALTACGMARFNEEQQLIVNRLERELAAAATGATIACASASCAKAFQLAKAYVRENADMKVQFSDESSIHTFGPGTGSGKQVGLAASITPGKADTSTIKLTAACQGSQYRQDPSYGECAIKMTRIYNGFKPFVEQRL